MKCQSCDRTEFVDLGGRIRPVRVNKDGICQVCVEVQAEAQADDDEVLRRAQQILATRRRAAARHTAAR